MKMKNDARESEGIFNDGNMTMGLPVVENGWGLLTTFEDGERILESLLAGGSVFLVRSSNLAQLTPFAGEDNRGGAIMPRIELQAMNKFHLLRISSNKVECLSPREHEVLELLASGFFYREVGKKLDIGMETVRTHVKKICSKMRVRNRIEAVAKYRSANS